MAQGSTEENWEGSDELLDDYVEIHPMTSNPTTAWQHMQQYENRQAEEIPSLLPLSTKVLQDHVRFVCISDTHNRLKDIMNKIPPGDVLIHAGDFTHDGKLPDVKAFNDLLSQLPHKRKIVIAGNHDMSFSNSDGIATDPRNLLTNCTYLEDGTITVYGINIYGSPWQPYFDVSAFNIPRGRLLLEKWERIPTNTDVLITHGPPVGHGDLRKSGERAGCVELLNIIEQRVKPRFHVFGHIHEGHGITTNNQGTIFINASTCNPKNRPENDPIIFDLPLPAGVSK